MDYSHVADCLLTAAVQSAEVVTQTRDAEDVLTLAAALDKSASDLRDEIINVRNEAQAVTNKLSRLALAADYLNRKEKP